MLVAFGGLPGSGKTTLARELARRWVAVYLRIDTIERAIISSGVLKGDVGPAGYITAYQIAEENLRNGRIVVADSVNALQVTRDSWRKVAESAHVAIAEVEVRCSNLMEHKRRIGGRSADVEGAPPLTWQAVADRPYEPWPTAHIVIDTAGPSIADAEDELIDRLTSFHSLAS